MHNPRVLVIVSGLFVILGIIILVVDPRQWTLAVVVIAFFGACAAVGVGLLVSGRTPSQGLPADRAWSAWLVLVLGTAFVVSGVVLAIGWVGFPDAGLRSDVMAPVMIVVCFGIGLALIARFVWMLRRRRLDGRRDRGV